MLTVAYIDRPLETATLAGGCCIVRLHNRDHLRMPRPSLAKKWVIMQPSLGTMTCCDYIKAGIERWFKLVGASSETYKKLNPMNEVYRFNSSGRRNPNSAD